MTSAIAGAGVLFFIAVTLIAVIVCLATAGRPGSTFAISMLIGALSLVGIVFFYVMWEKAYYREFYSDPVTPTKIERRLPLCKDFTKNRPCTKIMV